MQFSSLLENVTMAIFTVFIKLLKTLNIYLSTHLFFLGLIEIVVVFFISNNELVKSGVGGIPRWWLEGGSRKRAS
jgi:hypothetical protein